MINTQPYLLKDSKGQPKLTEHLQLRIDVARGKNARSKTLDYLAMPHRLFYAPPGFGKTTLGYIIAHELHQPALRKC
jgi:Holliday junction resolvasome RuvABC ATP-dependent DNA helicase subunit